MQIKSVVPQPYGKAVSPGIQFDLEVIYNEQALLSMEGWLKADDQKILSPILIGGYQSAESVEIVAHLIGENAPGDKIYKDTLISLFDKTSLDYIEERRFANQKRDVILNLELLVKTLDSRAIISNIHRVDHDSLGLTDKQLVSDARMPLSDAKLLANAYVQNVARPQRGDLWLISGNNGPGFLGLSRQILAKEIRIPATDWIHDYAPALDLGSYFIIEIPIRHKSIMEAWEYINKADDCFRKWDVKGVYANCREAGTLLDNVLKEKLGKDSFAYMHRWGRSFRGAQKGTFSDIASLGLHLEDLKKSFPPDDVQIGKPDTEHILVITKALAKYAEELI